MVAMGVEPYLREHLIKDAADYRTVENILERAEFVPQYEKLAAAEALVGRGTATWCRCFTASRSSRCCWSTWARSRSSTRCTTTRRAVERLLRLLDQQMVEILHRLADLPASYVEFPDNLHGGMTNPRLFARYCLPDYQRYTGILHGQGEKVGSHTDGDVKPLLTLLKESGLDVCESISPFPLTPCTFDEVWTSWQRRADHLGRHPVTAPGRRSHGRGRLPGVRGASAGHGRRRADHPGGGRSGDGQQFDRTSQVHRRAGRGARVVRMACAVHSGKVHGPDGRATA